MSNNFKNLIIVLVVSGVVLYFLNKLSNKKSENFTMLNKLVDGIENLGTKELEDLENKLSGEEEHSEEEQEHSEEEHSEEEHSEEAVKPVEEENNNATISESKKDLVISGINQTTKVNSKVHFKGSQKIDSNISSRMLTNSSEEELKPKNNINKKNNRIQQQLNEEEEFRKYLSGERGEQEYNQEEEYTVQPYAEEEMSKFIISEEESRFAEEGELKEERYRLPEEESTHVSNEIIDKKSKTDMKNRLRNQVKCGTFINPQYTKRISGCGSKAYMKLHKPINKKLNELRTVRAEDTPKAIRDIYNEVVPDYKKSKTSKLTCQHVQKGVSMKPCSSRFSVIGEEASELGDNIFANDSCFDPYSNF